MNKYHYCVNTFKNEEPVQVSGDIEAKSKEDAVHKLIDNDIVDPTGYEFLELKKWIKGNNLNLLKWNVYNYDFNSKGIKLFNIFKHGGFNYDVEKHLKKYKVKDEFAEHLKSSLMYYFWSRAEYELIIEITEDNRIFLSPWCGCNEPEKAKIDVTDDENFNWKDFAEEHIKKQVYKNEAKIDIYDQVMSNWSEFVDLCWNSKRRKKRKEIV